MLGPHLLEDALVLILEQLEALVDLQHRLAPISVLLDEDHLLLQRDLVEQPIDLGPSLVELSS